MTSRRTTSRICERLNVPRPGRGYWAKLRVGQNMERAGLPALRPGDEKEWLRGGDRARRTAPPVAPRVGSRKVPIEVGARHELLRGVREHFEAGRVSTYDSEKYLRPYKRNLVDLVTSKEALPYTLDTANALFLEFERRGHRVVLAPFDTDYARVGLSERGEAKKVDDYNYWCHRRQVRPTLLFIDTVAIGLTLFEVSEHVEVRYVSELHDYVRVDALKRAQRPGEWTTKQWLVSGRLGLHAYAPYRAIRWEAYWREGAPGELSKQFATIVKQLEREAPLIVQKLEIAAKEAEERRKKWEVEERERQKREAERRKVEEEKARVEELRRHVEQWRFARDARAMTEEVVQLASRRGLRVSKGGPIDEWIEWVLKQAAEADPIAELRKNIDDFAKEHRTSPRPPSPIGAGHRLRRRRS